MDDEYKSYWWGDQVAVSHKDLEGWTKAADVAAAIAGGLSASGVSAPVTAPIAAVLTGATATLKLIDNGNGIYINILKVKVLSEPIRLLLKVAMITTPLLGLLVEFINEEMDIDVVEGAIFVIGQGDIIVFPSRR